MGWPVRLGEEFFLKYRRPLSVSSESTEAARGRNMIAGSSNLVRACCHRKRREWGPPAGGMAEKDQAHVSDSACLADPIDETAS